jgi:hypothetical protein
MSRPSESIYIYFCIYLMLTLVMALSFSQQCHPVKFPFESWHPVVLVSVFICNNSLRGAIKPCMFQAEILGAVE